MRLFSCALKNAQLSHNSCTFYSRLPGDYELMNLIFLVDDHRDHHVDDHPVGDHFVVQCNYLLHILIFNNPQVQYFPGESWEWSRCKDVYFGAPPFGVLFFEIRCLQKGKIDPNLLPRTPFRPRKEKVKTPIVLRAQAKQRTWY